jgi:hypothetical protein
MAAEASGSLRRFPALDKARRYRRLEPLPRTRWSLERPAELMAVSIVVARSPHRKSNVSEILRLARGDEPGRLGYKALRRTSPATTVAAIFERPDEVF